MRISCVLILALAVAAAGCGSSTQTAGKPTDEAIQADKAHQQAIEQEERGAPVKGNKKQR